MSDAMPLIPTLGRTATGLVVPAVDMRCPPSAAYPSAAIDAPMYPVTAMELELAAYGTGSGLGGNGSLSLSHGCGPGVPVGEGDGLGPLGGDGPGPFACAGVHAARTTNARMSSRLIASRSLHGRLARGCLRGREPARGQPGRCR